MLKSSRHPVTLLFLIGFALFLSQQELRSNTNVGILTDLSSYELFDGIPLNRLIQSIEDMQGDNFIWPVRGLVSSGFGERRHPTQGIIRHHGGIDIAAPTGSPVFATASGKVSFRGEMKGYGKTVFLDHGNGLETIYGHNRVLFVEEGDLIRKGRVIALVGSTGISTGPHLHFEMRKNGKPVDPTSLPEYLSSVPLDETSLFPIDCDLNRFDIQG